jgi:fibro-slime domain-containing protein
MQLLLPLRHTALVPRFNASASLGVFIAVAALGCSASGESSTLNGGSSTGGGSSSPGDGTGGIIIEDPTGGQIGQGGASGNKCGTTLKVLFRDFKGAGEPGGHKDFEREPGLNDIGCGIVGSSLGADGKPVFQSSDGLKKRVVSNTPTGLAFAGCADWNGWVPGKRVVWDAESFSAWYNNKEGVNMPVEAELKLVESGPGKLAFDSNAFFPVDGQGFGNTPGQSHNYSFTTEAHAKFVYEKGQKFTFRGDDDLWIFVNGKLAMDLGGCHAAIQGTIDFDAQAAQLGITPGGLYQMDIYHAERHTSQSNFHVETSIACFQPVDPIQ